MKDENIELAKSIIEDYLARYIDVLDDVELDNREDLVDALLDYYSQEKTHDAGIKKIQDYIKVILMYGKIASSYKNNKTLDSEVDCWYIDVTNDPNFDRIHLWCMIHAHAASGDFEFKAVLKNVKDDIQIRWIINDINVPYECDENRDDIFSIIEKNPIQSVKLINKLIQDYINDSY